MKDSYITIAWLVLLIILLIIEIITVGLTSIWAAGGALAALVLNLLDISLLWQVVVFFIVTFVLLYGKTIRIAETVDNISQTGMAVVNGQEWTVRAEKENEILEPGTLAKVVNIAGVKLIVRKYEEE